MLMVDDIKNSLSANYSSSTSEPFAFSYSLTTRPSEPVIDKAWYLSGPRMAIATTQGQVGKELTARIDEMRIRPDPPGSKSAKAKAINEDRKEKIYDEEPQEEDD
jgi:hypothetical protein